MAFADEAGLFTDAEKKSLGDYDAEREKLQKLEAVRDPGEMAALMGMTPAAAEKLGADGVNQQRRAFIRHAYRTTGAEGSRLRDLTQQAKDRTSAEAEVKANTPLTDAEAAHKEIDKYGGKDNPQAWNQAFKEKRDALLKIVTNRDVRPGHATEARAAAIEYLKAARVIGIAEMPQSTRENMEEAHRTTGKLPVTMREQYVLSDLFDAQSGILPDYFSRADLNRVGVLPDQRQGSPELAQQAEAGGQLTRAAPVPQGGEFAPGAGAAPPPAAPGTGPLAGGGSVVNPNAGPGGPTLRFGQAPGGELTQEGVSTPGATPPAPAGPVAGNVPGIGADSALSPASLVKPTPSIGPASLVGATPPTGTETSQPTQPTGTTKPDPTTFAFQYKSRHPDATAQEIRQLYYQTYGMD